MMKTLAKWVGTCTGGLQDYNKQCMFGWDWLNSTLSMALDNNISSCIILSNLPVNAIIYSNTTFHIKILNFFKFASKCNNI